MKKVDLCPFCIAPSIYASQIQSQIPMNFFAASGQLTCIFGLPSAVGFGDLPHDNRYQEDCGKEIDISFIYRRLVMIRIIL